MRAKHALWLWLIGTTMLYLSSFDTFQFQQAILRIIGFGLEWLGLVVLVIKVFRHPELKAFLNT